MSARLRLFACLLPAALASAACDIGISAGGFEGRFDRDLAVAGPVELEITSGSGDIYVRTGPGSTVRIHGRARAGNGPWVSLNGRSAEERVRDIVDDPPIEQSGNRIQIGPGRGQGWDGGWNGVSISYEIIVPADTRLAARSGSGDLEVGDLDGPVELSTGSGDIRAGRIRNGVTARTGSGDVNVAGAASARTSTGSGTVIATGIRGDLEARSGSGDIIVSQQGKGRVDVSTGSGNVELEGVTGPLHVRASSGDIELEGVPSSEWDVSASSGDVRLRLAGARGVDLDLRSSSGRIETSIPITVTGRQSRRELRGQVRGGGPLVQVSTSSGSIAVQ